ncbi:hypothetical protein [Pseudovibrio sp. Ad26]|uniref:hypothetical protein n=1 Tax=Pseudovibrio sp. Ad26 TaxID=989410 RepID=UPI0012906642|nr:hypothetical protein [Pseudovibrio sp. Ad26]
MTSFAVGAEYAGSEEFLNVPGITRDASSHTISVQYKVATASEPSSYAVKRLTTGSFQTAWYQSVLFRISGVDPVNPFDGVATNVENGAAKNNGIFPSGVSTTTTDALVLAVVSARRHSGYDSGTISNWVQGWPEAYDDNIVSSVTRPGLAVAYFTQATPGGLPGGLQGSGPSDVQKTLSYIALRSDTATEPPPPPPWDGPFYEALSTGHADNTSTGSLTLPSGTEAGDLLLFLGDCDGVAGFLTLAGFQDLHGGPVVGAAGSSHRGGWQYRIADGTEPASYSVGFHSGSERAAFSLLRYSNVDPDNPIRASATKVGGKNQIVEFPTGLSTDVDDCLIVGSIAVESGNSGSPIVPDVNWPSDWTEVYDNFGGPPGGGDASASAAAAVFTMDSAGSIPAESATIIGGNTYWISSYIAIAPAPSSGGGTHDLGLITLEFSVPEITVNGFSQVHDLGGVSLGTSAPELGLSGFAQLHEFGSAELLASSAEISVVGFSVTVPSTTYELGSISVEFSVPEIEVGVFTQVHGLSSLDLALQPAVIQCGAFTQHHEFGAAAIALQAPEIELDGFTTFDPTITQELGSILVTYAVPEITVVGFSQVHNLGSADTALEPAAIQCGALTQHHEFGAAELTLRSPEVALGGFSQVHEFGAVSLAGLSPEIDVGAISVINPSTTYELGPVSVGLQRLVIVVGRFSQVHNLGAVEVAPEHAAIQCGAFTQHHEFGNAELALRTLDVTLGGFTQVHELGSASLVGRAAEVGVAQFNTFNPGATPLERIVFVPAETRVAFVETEDRTANVKPEDRALVL